jgi:DNA polymerase-3 subunit alpha
LQTEKPRIRFGLKAIRNLGENIVKAIIHERKANGKYQSLEDLLTRVKCKDLNKKSIEGLCKSGALDVLAERNSVLENLDRILLFVKEMEAQANNNQVSLFSLAGQEAQASLKLVEYPAAAQKQRLSWEKEFLGLYVTAHPYADIESKISDDVVPLGSLKQKDQRPDQVLVAGVITDIKKIITSKGDPMLFVKIEDTIAAVELLIFPRLYNELQDLFLEEKIVVALGKVSEKDDEPKVLADMAWEITALNYKQVLENAKTYEVPRAKWAKRNILIKYPKGASHDLANKVKQVFASYPGSNVVFLQIEQQLVKTNFKVKYCQQFTESIQAVLGEAALSVK